MRQLDPDGEDRLLARLIALYRDDSSQLLADMDNGLKVGDAEAVARAAHTLKSSSANLGATNVAAIARAIETLGARRRHRRTAGLDDQAACTAHRRAVRTRSARQLGQGGLNARHGCNPIHVLIVDDDAGSRLLMRRALERSGLRRSPRPPTAPRRWPRWKPAQCNAVLMDVEMPSMNGYDACKAIRARPGGAHLPIMMVTGRDDVASINQSYQAGATDFLAKPINWNLLGHRVQYLVRGGRLVQELEESEGRQRAMLDALPDLLLVVDMHDRIVDRLGAADNHPFLAGRSSAEQKIAELVSGEAARAIAHALDDCRVRNERTEVEFECMREGMERRFETRIVPYDRGRLLLVLRDVTERHRAANRIRELAFFDPLTQLPNRQYLLQLLEEARREAATTGERFAVVRINLDQFKRINDSIGHGAGDALLQAVASRLGTFLKLERDGAVTMPLARLTGDEFAVAIRHLQSDADVQAVIHNIMAAFASPFLIRHRDFFVTCTIGIAIFPDHGSFADELLRTAGLALHEAKTSGGNRGVIYSEHMRARSVERLELETELRRALEAERAVPRLSAADRAGLRPHRQCRSAGALAPSDARHRAARRIHLRSPRNPASSCRSRTWSCARRCKQISEWWKAGLPRPARGRERFGRPVRSARLPGLGVRASRRGRPARDLPRARDHREPADGATKPQRRTPCARYANSASTSPSTISALATRRSPTSSTSPSRR